jgi:hypothetical protein
MRGLQQYIPFNSVAVLNWYWLTGSEKQTLPTDADVVNSLGLQSHHFNIMPVKRLNR